GSSRAFAAAPGFTITATNVTMPLDTQQYGQGTFTLTSVNGYTGGPLVTCTVVNPPANAKLPACYQHGLMPVLPANGTLTGTLLFVAPGQIPPPEPAGLRNRPHRSETGIMLAAALLFGFCIRRRRTRWFRRALLVLITLYGVTVLSACGGNGNGMTAGSYTYNVNASDASTGGSASTTINVTIP
ncbi:MAG: hypothetical protein WAK26_14045, partial [Terracidiphilus sp.]